MVATKIWLLKVLLSSIKGNINERMLLREKRTQERDKSTKSIILCQQVDTTATPSLVPQCPNL